MSDVIVFAGTTEGRRICEFLRKYEVSAIACTATEYGKCRIEEGRKLRVLAKRQDEQEMEELFRNENPKLIIDATHPYADIVSCNIRSACSHTDREYFRLLRPALSTDPSCILVESVEEAVAYLKEHPGKALVTTGSKELVKFTDLPKYQERIYARVLPTASVMKSCQDLGFDAAHLIGMQGPFTLELNSAMLEMIGASYLVTKESGKNGGFEEKIEAAKQSGAAVIVIGRPVKETGLSEDEIKRELIRRFEIPVRRELIIAGIGMGGLLQMTGEVDQACQEADLLIGADRMLSAADLYHKPGFVSYRSEEIRDYILQHPEYEKIVLLQSGDVGFYSGAKRLQEVLSSEEGMDIKLLPGISSVVYLCAKQGIPWQDVRMISLHGRECNYVDEVKHHRRVFALTGKDEEIKNICKKFLTYGMKELTITVAGNLSYPDETIISGKPEELLLQKFSALSVLMIENPHAENRRRRGIPDEEFLRDQVPMTKREVRNSSLSHLQLQPDSVVYDIGAGTGSVSIEMALEACQGKVYAIEKNPSAVELLRKNKIRFAVDNLEIIEGTAPEALEELPVPTHAFIGGSSGNLRKILEILLEKNAGIHVVLNAVTLETQAEAVACFRELPFGDPEVVCIQAATSRLAGKSHLMIGQNPVYIFTASGGGIE
ncbi:MAG: precorrin-6A reductase [Fusicatenibacter sp.]|nr:precorrin-6A reductase [Lachnospiraceae bacterium]MDY2938261.1 precorrin-6A reductase [Fusicatenibacter sp.]